MLRDQAPQDAGGKHAILAVDKAHKAQRGPRAFPEDAGGQHHRHHYRLPVDLPHRLANGPLHDGYGGVLPHGAGRSRGRRGA
eukprot:3546816-Heterocapsa_arctica.AAC.1